MPSTRGVKSLDKLEKELQIADSSGDKNQVRKIVDSMRKQIKLYYISMILDGLLIGILTTSFNIWNTTRRVLAGKFKLILPRLCYSLFELQF